jgi:hypothetical protein
MDHLDRNLQGRLARDEDDAAPVRSLHWTNVVPTQPDATQQVHLKESPPIVVRDCFERLWLEYSKIIDEYVDGGKLGDHGVHPGLRTKICRDPVGCATDSHRFGDPLLCAAVHDDGRTLFCQRGSDRQADAGSGSGHQGSFAVQL